MSETPRTDFYDCHGGPGTTEPACGACVTCLHRVIEDNDRELAAAQKERDDALMMLGVYKTKSEEQQKRIKRILNAGDAMEKQIDNGLCLHGVTVEWNKAKDEKAS